MAVICERLDLGRKCEAERTGCREYGSRESIDGRYGSEESLFESKASRR